MSKRALPWIVLLWQAVVCALVIGGIFVEIFELFGIPWNSFGWRNILGTALGWVLLESPLLVLVAWFCLLGKKGLRNPAQQDASDSRPK